MSFCFRWAAGWMALILLMSLTVSADVIYSPHSGAVPGESSASKASADPASSWVDDCDSTASPYVVYQNLQPTDRLASFDSDPAPKDTTGLTLTHPEYLGRAIYSVWGRSSVNLTLFSHDGTFATQGEEGWVRGGETDALDQVQRLYYDSQSGRIFLPTEEGDLTYCYQLPQAEYSFCQLPGSLSRDEWYGLSLSYSLDGTRFVPIAPGSCRITRYDSPMGLQLYQEDYTLSLPEGALYLQVELREVPAVPKVKKQSGQWVETGSEPRAPFSYPILASVQLNGGSPTPPLPAPLPEEEEEEEEEDAHKKDPSSPRSSSSGGTSNTTTNTTTETVDNRSTSENTTTTNNTTTTINNYYFFTPEALAYLEEMDPSLLTLGDSGLAYAMGSSFAASQPGSSPTLAPEIYLLLIGGCILFLFAVLFKQSK